MKWFRHETDGPTSEEITQLVKLTGFAGKGRWYTLKELVAAQMDNSDRCHVEYPSLEWGRFLGLKQKKLKTFLKHCENIFKIFVECHEEILKISIPKLLEERDFYSKRFEQKEKNVRTKIEIESKIKHPLPPQGGLPASPSPKNGTRIPEDFQLTQERKDFALKNGINGGVETIFAGFCDYWKAKPGKDARKLDWDATWKNWCRNQKQFSQRGMPNGPPKKQPNFRD